MFQQPRAHRVLCLFVLSSLAASSAGRAQDCNANGRPDGQDLAGGSSADCNRNGIPDECDLHPGGRPGSLVVFRCDDGKGLELLDVSGGLRHGKIRGAVFDGDDPFQQPGNLSLRFTAPGQAVDVPAGNGSGFEGLQAISLAAYVRPDSAEGLRYVVWGDDDVFSLRLRDGLVELVLNGKIAASLPAPASGVWTHLCGVYDGAEARIYRNGKLAVRNPAKLGPVDAPGSRAIVRIGNDETVDMAGFDRGFRGAIDQVRIAGRALLDLEIQEDAREPYTPGASRDCDGNGIPDECDVASGRALDRNRNGVPDTCEVIEPPVLGGLEELRQASIEAPRVQLRQGAASWVRARVRLDGKGSLLDQVLEYLERFRELHGLTDPRNELVLSRVTERLGNHFYFTQIHQGLPVLHSEIGVHVLGGEVLAVTGRLVPYPPHLEPASLRSAAASAAAREVIPALGVSLSARPRLVIYNEGLITGQTAPTQLAWRCHLEGIARATGTPGTWEALVDAHSGRILKVRSALQAETPDRDLSLRTAGNTEPEDCDDLEGEEWFDEDGPTSDYPGTFPGGDAEGDLAFRHLGAIYDFYHSAFDRHAWDDCDGEIVGYVHYGDVDENNAYFDPNCELLLFANGFVQNDTMAHEYTHAVTYFTADLLYEDQSGALNESYSDVMAAFFDGDWTEGEDRAGGASRDLSNPPAKGQPDHMRNLLITADDNGGVHTNSGIPNKAAFLISEGGTHNGLTIRGLGREKARQLYYFVLTQLLGQASQFQEAADLTVLAAEIFAFVGAFGFTRNDVCQVVNAFSSVGLGESDIDCDGIRESADRDDDGDLVPDAQDNCPQVPNPSQADLDGDGAGDACDLDDDGDGVAEDGGLSGVDGDRPCVFGAFRFCDDNCPRVRNPDQRDDDADGIGEACDDDDHDGRTNDRDNCRSVANPDQRDSDQDQLGDACDTDDDNDQVPDATDNCRFVANPGQEDADGDGVGQACDNCPSLGNPDQADYDRDGAGDACDTDDDDDGVPDATDNCQFAYNPDQLDIDGDGDGLECDLGDQHLLYGMSTVQWIEHLAHLVDRVPRTLDLPIGPCRQDCPDWLPETFQNEVRLAAGEELEAHIVDERGFLVARARSVSGGERELVFRPRPDAQQGVGPTDNRGGGASVNGSELAPEGEEDLAFVGRRYFLRLTPRAGTRPGTRIPFRLAVGASNGAEPTAGGALVPGDGNGDGRVDLSDTINLLGYLFQGTTRALLCGNGTGEDRSNLQLLDWNGDEKLDISDAVSGLSYLFAGGPGHVLGTTCVSLPACPDSCPLE